MIGKKNKLILNCCICGFIVIMGIYVGLMQSRVDTQNIAPFSTWAIEYAVLGKECEISIYFNRWVNSSSLLLNNCPTGDLENSSAFIPLCFQHYTELNVTLELIINGISQIFTVTNISGMGSLSTDIDGVTYYLAQASITRYTPKVFSYNTIEIRYTTGKYSGSCYTRLVV